MKRSRTLFGWFPGGRRPPIGQFDQGSGRHGGVEAGARALKNDEQPGRTERRTRLQSSRGYEARGTGHERRPSESWCRARLAADGVTGFVGAGKLRVAILAPISWRVPPRRYGTMGTISLLFDRGVGQKRRRGHLVRDCRFRHDGLPRRHAPTGYSEDPALDAKVWEALHISALFERADEFDVIHNSFDFLPLTYSGLVETPVVTTIHGFSSDRFSGLREVQRARLLRRDQRSDRHPSLDYTPTIHHGIDLARSSSGRAGATTCCSSAGSTQTRGRWRRSTRPSAPASAGDRRDRPGRDYFERLVEPRIDGERVASSAPLAPTGAEELLGGARRSCTSSTSTSRSASASSRRWPAAPR